MFSFLKSFVGVKGKQLGRDIVEAIVELDPNAATEAQLAEMEKDLDQAGMLLQKIRTDLEREQREADAAVKRYNQMMGAAEHLQAQLNGTSVSDRASVEASLAKLVVQLEGLVPEVEQEKQDVVEVQALLDETQAAYKAKAEALASAKQGLDRAKRDMQRAVLQEERAGEKAKRAAEVAGLRGSGPTNKLSIAVDAMHRRAEEARAKAANSTMKAETLSIVHRRDDDDPNIAAALKAVEGGPAAGNLTDRLAALKKK
ncbi:MAG: hypothetical protein H7840_15775 [Alphaproteobacteria bacterium]